MIHPPQHCAMRRRNFWARMPCSFSTSDAPLKSAARRSSARGRSIPPSKALEQLRQFVGAACQAAEDPIYLQ